MGTFGTTSFRKPALEDMAKKCGLHLLIFIMSVVGLTARLVAQTIQSEPVMVGYQAFNFDGGDVTSVPTEEKPESKAWYHDNLWWGVMWDNIDFKYKIFRLNATTQEWTNTGTEVDSRPRSSADVLVDSDTLYISNRAKESHKASHGPETATLVRYTYNSGSKTYSLDVGFPVNIPGTAITRAFTIAKDSNGKLWATWTASTKVMVNRTLSGDDTNWGTAFELPVQGGNLASVDISVILAFAGSKVGILWSNQVDEKDYFAVHQVADADTVWQSRETAFDNPGGGAADDHLNFAYDSDSGTILAAVKTTISGSTSPIVVALKRESSGVWSHSSVWLKRQDFTRPIMLHNSDTDSVYVFAKSDSVFPKTIFFKSAHINNFNFPSGLGRTHIFSVKNDNVNNVTSTKQSVTNTSGILVLASDKTTKNYLYNLHSFDNQRPVANEDRSPANENSPLAIDVTANDTDSDGTLDKSTVAVVLQPANGTASANTATGEIVYTSNVAFAGNDTLYYSVADDDGLHAVAARIIVTVNDSPLASDDFGITFEDTPIDLPVLANDVDADGTIDPATFTITSPPSNGGAVASVAGVVTYTPNFNFNGTDSFLYTVQDDSGGVSNEATVTIVVSNVLDAPVAGNDGATLTEDGSTIIDVLANDTDSDGSIVPTTVAVVMAPGKGATSVNPVSGQVTYTPVADSSGSDLFTYTVQDNDAVTSNEATVTLTINEVNDAPVANNDTIVTAIDVPIDILITANDTDVDGTIDTTSVLASSGSHGTTLIKPDGFVTYTPASGYFGTDEFIYTVRDNDGAFSNPATAHIVVNKPPTAIDDVATTVMDSSVIIDVTSNDTDDVGTIDASTVVIVSSPGSGSATVSLSGGFVTYTPNSGFSGADAFTYKVNDDNGAASNTATVSVSVTVNARPDAVDDVVATGEDIGVSINVLSNDLDSDGTLNPASVAVIGLPASGQTSVNGAGAVTYTPDPNFFGSDFFTYTVEDNYLAVSDTATVSITVSSINDAPIANRDTVSTNEDVQIDFDVTGNDSDVENGLVPASVTIVIGGTHGQGSVNPATGIVSYLPDADFFGTDSLRYTVQDDSAAVSNQTTVLINVVDVNDLPIAVNDTTQSPHGMAVEVDVKLNDSDSDGSLVPGSVTVVNPPAKGATSVSLTGVITYTPTQGTSGIDSFDYTISDDDAGPSAPASVFVTVNKAPDAVDDAPVTREDTPVGIAVAANDTDMDGSVNPATVSLVTPPAAGSAVVASGSGVVTYTPPADFFGADSLTYTVEDDLGRLSNIATVRVTVAPINDPPVSAVDTFSVSEDTPATLSVLGNDTDIDGALELNSVTVTTPPGHGTAIPDPSGAISFVPTADFFGFDSLRYTVADDSGAVSGITNVVIEITATNDTPVAANDIAGTDEDTPLIIVVTSNDTDLDGTIDVTTVVLVGTPSNGTASATNSGAISYQPGLNFFGNDTLTYTVKDNAGAESNTAEVVISVAPQNDPPVAAIDIASANEETAVAIDVLDNDSDVDGSLVPATVSVVQPPTHGGTSVNPANGFISYTPALNYVGLDTLRYRVADDQGALDSAFVYLAVTGVNDNPVANDDAASTAEETPVTVAVVANDSDVDGTIDVTSVSVVAAPAHGSAAADVSGNVVYSPAANFFGSDSLQYTVQDNNGGVSNTAMLRLTVTSTNDAPVAVSDAGTTPEETSIQIDLAANDTDIDGSVDATSVTITVPPVHGTGTVNSTPGVLTYIPALDFNGTDTLAYTIADNLGAVSAAGEVLITVTAVNDPPVALPDGATTPEETAVDISVASNDTDVDGSVIASTVVVVKPASNGTHSVNGSGVISYQPELDFFGSDTLRYTIQDNSGATSNEAEVVISVSDVNEIPVAFNDTLSAEEDTPANLTVLANDIDPDNGLDPATVAVQNSPVHGTASVNTATGEIAYTPALDFSGQDSLDYSVRDAAGALSNTARVYLTIDAVNDAPVATADFSSTQEETQIVITVVSNDTDVDGSIDPSTVSIVQQPGNGSASAGTGEVTYTPAENFVGNDTLHYTVRDNVGALSSPGQVVVTVTNINDPPVAADDVAATPEDVSVTINVPANDSDLDGTLDLGSVTILSHPDQGSATVSGSTGAISYQPNVNFFGNDTLSYTIKDNSGAVSNDAQVIVVVADVNDAPVAVDDNVITPGNQSVDIEVLGNDSDVDGTLVPSSIFTTVPSNGMTATQPGGIITYTPNAGFSGTDQFVYRVNDEDGAFSNLATVSITISAAPVAGDDVASTHQGQPVSIVVLTNDTDADGTVDTTTVAVVSGPANGTTSIDNTTGHVTYTPAPAFFGIDSFSYTVADTDGGVSNVATVSIAVNGRPLAQDDVATTNEEASVAVDVLANDADPDGTLAATTVSVTLAPAHGSTTVNTVTGVVTYLPELNFVGIDSFQYSVKDNLGALSDVATAVVTISDVNDPPVAVSDVAATTEDTPTSIQVLANDSDLDGTLDATSVMLVFQPHSGTASVNTSSGLITYQPNPNFFGMDTLSYTVRDNDNAPSNIALVVVTVSDQNDAPVAVTDSVLTNQGVAITTDVLVNDTDLDGTLTPSSVTVVSGPVNGSASVNTANGTITYTPGVGTFPADSLRYTVADNLGATSNQAIYFIGINGRPTAVNDAVVTPEDTPIEITVAANDTDPEGSLDHRSVAITLPPSAGAAVADSLTGVVTFTPALDFSGISLFMYTISDQQGVTSAPALVSVNVTSENDPPVVVDDTVSTSEDMAIVVQVLSNDSDIDGTLNAATVTVVAGPAAGSTTVNSSTGEITYTPALNFSGPDTLLYTVKDNSGLSSSTAAVWITVTPVNDAPIAVDDSETTSEDTPVQIAIIQNDSDVDGLVVPTSVTLTGGPSSGTAQLDSQTGVVTYTPNSNFSGPDSFTYTVADNQGLNSNEATVSLSVVEQNDLPVAVLDISGTLEDNSVVIDVLQNDTDNDGSLDVTSVAIAVAPPQGSVSVDNTTGRLTYTPNSNFFGLDTFAYTVKDDLGATSLAAWVSVTVSPVNDAPVANNDSGATNEDTPVELAVTNNDSDIDGTIDSTTVIVTLAPKNGATVVNQTTGVVTYSPAPNFSGPDSLAYTVSDNSGSVSDTAKVFITVGPVNDSPVANHDTVQTPEDQAVSISVLNNDTDADGTLDATSVTVTAQPDSGTAVVNPVTGEITYIPNANFFGADSLRYTAKDNAGALTNEATVRLTVTPVNDVPVATDDSETTSEDTPALIAVLLNDSDLDGTLNPSSVVITISPKSGVATPDAQTGVLTYLPSPDFFGSDTLSYTVNDNEGASSNTAQVIVTVVGQNDPPVAALDVVGTFEDNSVVVAVLQNDADSDGSLDPTSVVVAAQPTRGSVLVNATSGALTYSPNPDFFGADSLRYTVKDNVGATSNAATVRLTINPVNDPPVAVDDSETASEDTPLVFAVLGNDSDVDGNLDPGSLSILAGPVNGTTTVNPNSGVITYAPSANYSGLDSLTYQVADTDGLTSNIATVRLSVVDQNDPPLAVNDTLATDEDVILLMTVLGNDIDDTAIDATTLTVVSVARHGFVTGTGVPGQLSYSPEPDYFGGDTMSYTVKDNFGATSNVATVFITVASVNDAPVALDDTASTTEETPVSFSLVANDSDTETPLALASVSIVTPPGNGSAVTSNGNAIYSPNTGFIGTDSFQYTVQDADGLTSNTATATVSVAAAGELVTSLFGASDDGQVKLTEPAKNYGSKETMKIEKDAFRLYLKFQVSDLAGPVQSAVLRLRVASGASAGGEGGGVVHLAENTFTGTTTPWSEGLLTSGNAPDTLGSVIASVNAVTPDEFVDFDVSSAVQGNLTYSFCISNLFGDIVEYNSKEGVSAPELIVTSGQPAANIPPVAVDDTATTPAVTPVVIDVLANDTDSDGSIEPGTVVVSVVSTGGTSSVNAATGAITYSPNPGFSGQDSLAYRVQDDAGATSNAANVRLTVLAGPAPPLAANDTTSTTTDTPVTVDVTANDTDSDGTVDVTTVAIDTAPLNGSAVVNSSTGIVTYAPNAAFVGSEQFTYVVKDNSGLVSNAATVTVSVSAGNFAPVALNDAASTVESIPVIVDVLANDSDSDGKLDTASVAVVTAALHGTTSVNPATGEITYNPGASFTGVDSLKYTVADNDGARSDTANVEVSVSPSGGIQTRTFNATEDGQVKHTEPGSNYGSKGTMKVDGGKFSSYFKFEVTGVSGPVQSAVVQLRVTSDPSDGSDSGGAIFPVANSFDGTSLPWVDETLAFGNAPKTSGSPLQTLAAVAPSQLAEFDVTASVTGDGVFSFAINPVSGNEVKYFTQEGGVAPKLVITFGAGGSNQAPVAVDDNAVTSQDTPVTVSILSNDSDADGQLVVTSVVVQTQPLNGSVSVNGTSGEMTYTPAAAFAGTDQFTYTVEDDDGAVSNVATVTVVVSAGNQAPVAADDATSTTPDTPVVVNVLGNDSDSDGILAPATVAVVTSALNGTTIVNGASGEISYTPNAAFSGIDSFTYTVNDDDGAASNSATVTVTVSGGGSQTFVFEAVGDGQIKLTDPGANYGSKGTMKVDGGKFSSYMKFVVTGLTGAVSSAKVRLQVTADARDGGDSGGAIFSVANTFNGSATPWVEQTLTSGNAPQAAGSPRHTHGPVAPSEVVDFEVTSAVSGNGTFSFAINPVSTNEVKYFTKDGSVSPKLVIVVGSGGGANQPPVAVDDNATTPENTPVLVNVLNNDSDADGQLILSSVTLQTQPSNGAATVNTATGEIAYTPAALFVGSDQFSYSVEDDDGAASNVAVVTVVVSAGNVAPVATDDAASTTESTPTVVDVLANDIDSDGTLDATTVIVVSGATNGATSVNAVTGAITYTPNTAFTGSDAFAYTVTDNAGASSNQATVTIAVAPAGGGQTLTFESVDDGQVKKTDPGANYGTKATMKVDGGKFSSYMKFVVTGLSGSVTSAKVRLQVTPDAGDGGDSGGSIFLVGNNFDGTATPWQQEALTSGNAPATSGSPLQTLAAVSPSQLVEFDVTGAVAGNGTFSFAVDPASTNEVKYYTREGSVPPKLVVVTGAGGGNQSPLAIDDAAAAIQGVPVIVDVTANDSDPDGTIDVTTVQIGTQPNNGTVSVNPTFGTVTYTPSSGFFGNDSFTYTVRDDDGAISNSATVSISVSGGNIAPVAVDDNSSAIAGNPVAIDVTLNDSDPDGTLLVATVTIATQPANGSINVSTQTGLVTYTPNSGFSGTDSFTYTVEDNEGAVSNAATVTLSVTGGVSGGTFTFGSVEDNQVKLSAPVLNYGEKGTMKVDRGKFQSYLKFDVTGVTGVVQSAVVRLHVTTDPGDGSDSGGSIYLASNNLTGTTTPWQEETLASGNAPDLLSGALSTLGAVSENEIVEFDVAGVINGNGTFSFCLKSGSGNQVKYFTKEGLTSPQLIITTGSTSGVEFAGNELAPKAVADWVKTEPGVTATIDVLLNDEAGGSPLLRATVAAVTMPASGTVRVDAETGKLVYTPAPGFTGKDAFDYLVYSQTGEASNPARVFVSVERSNAGTLRAEDHHVKTFEGVPVSVALVGSTGSGPKSFSTVEIVEPPAGGTITVDAVHGGATYLADAGFIGRDKFTYVLKDGAGLASNPGTVTVVVQASEPQVIALLPTDDAFVRSTSPTDNFGALDELRATNGSAEFHSYLKFDISGLTGAVGRALLRLHLTDGSKSGSVYLVSNNYRDSETPWQEAGLVWDNAPPIGSPAIATFEADRKGQYVEIDISGVVGSEGSYSFAVSGGSDTDASIIGSKEGLHPPELILETGMVVGDDNDDQDDIASDAILPASVSLSPNYPNPFNAETTILYALPAEARVTIEIYNIRGQLVATPVDAQQKAGRKRMKWFGRDNNGLEVSSGVYFLRLKVGAQTLARRLILQK